jgi:hypothetical protein
MQKHLQAKKKHHYVWADYLKRWGRGTNDVFWLTTKGKIAHDSVDGITKDDFFYKVKPMSDLDMKMIIGMSSACAKHLQQKHAPLLHHFLDFQAVEEAYRLSGNSNKDIEKLIHAFSCNGMEDLHTFHENSVQNVMAELANENLAVLDVEKNWRDFCAYLGQQSLRTKRVRDTYFQAMARHSGVKPEHIEAIQNTWWLTSFLLGMNLAESLVSQRGIAQISMLINNTRIPFITSDHPVINVHPSLSNVTYVQPKHTDFFYPISPSVGIAICDTKQFRPGKCSVDELSVIELNTKMAEKAYQHVIGDSEEVLDAFKRFVGRDTKKFLNAVPTIS